MLETLGVRINMALAVLGLSVLGLMGISWCVYQNIAKAHQEVISADLIRRQTEIKHEVQAIRSDLAARRGDWNTQFVSRADYHQFERRIEAQLQTLESRVEELELLADRPQRLANKVSVNPTND